MRPDKLEIVNEVWDDARIRGYLDKFVAAGRNLDARGRLGQTLLETIAGHRHGAPFRQILQTRLAG
jgi:hypothetical protein